MSFLYPRPATSCFKITSMMFCVLGERLLERIANIWQYRQMTGTLYGLCYLLLKLQAGSRQTAGKYLALLIDKLQQEVRILVVDVFDTILLKAAVLRLDLRTLYGFIH